MPMPRKMPKWKSKTETADALLKTGKEKDIELVEHELDATTGGINVKNTLFLPGSPQ
jgi:hypothetical protein